MTDYTVTFTHPGGKLPGLHTRDIVEKALTRHGFTAVSAGTSFKRSGPPNRYDETVLVVEGKKVFPDKEIRKLLKDHKVRRLRLSRTKGS